jgi:hypothetical protein
MLTGFRNKENRSVPFCMSVLFAHVLVAQEGSTNHLDQGVAVRLSGFGGLGDALWRIDGRFGRVVLYSRSALSWICYRTLRWAGGRCYELRILSLDVIGVGLAFLGLARPLTAGWGDGGLRGGGDSGIF